MEKPYCLGPCFHFSHELILLVNVMTLLNDRASFFCSFSYSHRLSDVALAEQLDKMIYCNDAGDSQMERQLESESGVCSVPATLSTREHLKPEARN